MKLVHRRCPEWHSAYQHHEKADARTPHVSFKSTVPSSLNYFGSNVCGGAALIVHALSF